MNKAEQRLIRKKQFQKLLATIRHNRNQQRINQHEMALKLGISQNAYSRIETGATKLSLIHFFKICQVLEVRADLLIQDIISQKVSA